MTKYTRGPFIDPRSLAREQETNLSGNQLVALSRKLGWKRTKIYGRWWIDKADYESWLSTTADATPANPHDAGSPGHPCGYTQDELDETYDALLAETGRW